MSQYETKQTKKQLTQTLWNKNDIFSDDIIYEDDEGEYRYNRDTGTYTYYPDWLGGSQSEEEFWETV